MLCFMEVIYPDLDILRLYQSTESGLHKTILIETLLY